MLDVVVGGSVEGGSVEGGTDGGDGECNENGSPPAPPPLPPQF